MQRRSGLSLALAVTALCAAAFVSPIAAPKASAAVTGPPQPVGPSLSTAASLAQKRYVAAGDRAYVIGAEDGSFPPMGWHIRGEMGGVWAHPIKLLDGYWFGLNGTWLPAAQSFTTGAGYVQMKFPSTAGYDATLTEFSPDGSPVMLAGLTVSNPGPTRRPSRSRRTCGAN